MFSSHSFWTSSSLDVPAGVTQEEGHTGFLIHLLSAVRALIFLARRIQSFLSLVDREVELCVQTIQSFSTRWHFFFFCITVFLFPKSGDFASRDMTVSFRIGLSGRDGFRRDWYNSTVMWVKIIYLFVIRGCYLLFTM